EPLAPPTERVQADESAVGAPQVALRNAGPLQDGDSPLEQAQHGSDREERLRGLLEREPHAVRGAPGAVGPRERRVAVALRVLGAEQDGVVRAAALGAAAAAEVARLVVVQAVDRRVVEEADAPLARALREVLVLA